MSHALDKTGLPLYFSRGFSTAHITSTSRNSFLMKRLSAKSVFSISPLAAAPVAAVKALALKRKNHFAGGES
jgi:hypothetical protein